MVDILRDIFLGSLFALGILIIVVIIVALIIATVEQIGKRL